MTEGLTPWLAVVAALVAFLANLLVTWMRGRQQLQLEEKRSDRQLQLEEKRRETELILEAVRGVSDRRTVRSNLEFFAKLGFLSPAVAREIEQLSPEELPVFPSAGYPTCAAVITSSIAGPLNDEGGLEMTVNIATGSIDLGTQLSVSTVRLHLDCDGRPPSHPACVRQPPALSFLGDDSVTGDLVNPDLMPIAIKTGHQTPVKAREITFEFSPELVLPANNPGGSFFFELKVDMPVRASGIPYVLTLIGRCDNGLVVMPSSRGLILPTPSFAD